MELTRLDNLMDISKLEDCLACAETLFMDYLVILKAAAALYGSSDGHSLIPEECEDFLPDLTEVYNGDPEGKFTKALCNLIGKDYPLTVKDGVFVWDTIAQEEREGLGRGIKWIYPQYHFFGEYPPATYQPDEGTYFRLAYKKCPENSERPDHFNPFTFVGLGDKPPDSTLERADMMFVLSNGYFDFLKTLEGLIKHLLLPLQPILAANYEKSIALPYINNETIIFSETFYIKYDVQGKQEKINFPSYKSLFDMINAYEAKMLFKYSLIGAEIDRRVITTNRADVQPKKWSVIMTKESACRKRGFSRSKLYRYLEKRPDSIMDLGRQNYRFNCNDPAFCDFPVDDAYNQMNNKKS